MGKKDKFPCRAFTTTRDLSTSSYTKGTDVSWG